MEEVERVSTWFAIIAGITLVASFFEVAMFMYTGVTDSAQSNSQFILISCRAPCCAFAAPWASLNVGHVIKVHQVASGTL